MNKILVLCSSCTGNTEMMAKAIVDYIQKQNNQVVFKSFEFDLIEVEELLDYDLVLIGTHSADDGQIPYEAEDFYDELSEVDLTDRLMGVFGSGESFYDVFCESIELMGDHLEHLGAKLVPERLKVELEPDDDDIIRCEAFAEKACAMIQEVH
ncbi:flavodoxin domain-containing protein [Oceanobacillus polygoni]|uniref:Flavodoxin I n=1 Tax=Oceanobacillus polygoni TaxID=1235259 RepID=A0A9X0YUG7_9BACI|nr:flavodoxin domain-containing protein [Oceanobacillus polygoni]MBP2078859.1 flavodoxin I [Oceanobacillus polygoni]